MHDLYGQLLELYQTNNPDNQALALNIMKGHRFIPAPNQRLYQLIIQSPKALQHCIDIQFEQFLQQITTLNWSYSNHHHLHPVLFQLPYLSKLIIRGAKIYEISQKIKEMKVLESLDLSHNLLDELPSTFSTIPHLKFLDFENNLFEALPLPVLLLDAVEKLNFKNNSIQEISHEVRYLKQLKTLDLFDNEIQELPGDIGKLQQLKLLDLGYNELKTLPEELGDLKALEILNLEDNEINVLPDTIGQMSALVHLNLKDTLIDELPESIENLGLKTLLLPSRMEAIAIEKAQQLLPNTEIKIA